MRQIRRLFRYAQHELGDRLDGVTLRFVYDLEIVLIVDRSGTSRAEKVLEGHSRSAIDDLRREASEYWNIPEGELLIELYGSNGVYSPATRLIRISTVFGASLDAAGEEIGHAALCVPHSQVAKDKARLERNLEEAFAGTLGRIELVVDFLASEGKITAEEIAAEKARRHARFWRFAEAPPTRDLFTGSTVHSEPYHHDSVTRAIVEEIVHADISLREKFIRARQAILLHTGTGE